MPPETEATNRDATCEEARVADEYNEYRTAPGILDGHGCASAQVDIDDECVGRLSKTVHHGF